MAMEPMYYMALWQCTMAIYVLKKFQAYMKRGLVHHWGDCFKSDTQAQTQWNLDSKHTYDTQVQTQWSLNSRYTYHTWAQFIQTLNNGQLTLVTKLE